MVAFIVVYTSEFMSQAVVEVENAAETEISLLQVK